ncbi:MAG: apolipoprotein N-acyltransferase [Actinomycetota bacterium]
MPPWGWWPLALVGLAWYARLAVRRRDTSPFSTAFLFGLGWFAPSTAWMWFLTAPGWVAVVALFAAMHGTAAIVAARVAAPDERSHRIALVVGHALAETVRLSVPFGGVPIATLAIGQADSPLARLAPWGGVIVIGTTTLWLAMGPRRARAIATLLALGFVFAPLADRTSADGEVRIAVVQGGGEQGTHAVDTDPREPFERHLEATRTIAPDTARDLVLWPENVINVTARGVFDGSREHQEIAGEARRLGVPFVVGITEDAGGAFFTNAQVVVMPNGEIVDRYDKVRRVPYGEYVPLRPLLSALGAPVDMVPRDARAGEGRARLDMPVRDGDLRMAVAISWEVFFGGRVNEGIADGARIVVNPTNGSSYTWTILQTQQVASSRLRAREQGRWVVQSSPTGFSGFVSANGTMFDRVGISERAVIERTVPLREGRTVYSRLGNAPYIWALLAIMGVMAMRTRGLISRPSS